jgi:hypothetical protein
VALEVGNGEVVADVEVILEVEADEASMMDENESNFRGKELLTFIYSGRKERRWRDSLRTCSIPIVSALNSYSGPSLCILDRDR